MAKGLQIVTANRLSDGAVLYWCAPGWSEVLAEAKVLEADAAKPALAEAAKAIEARQVVGVYAFEVQLDRGAAVPVKERELIRAAGPSVRHDLGKQADGRYAPPPPHPQVRRADTTPGEEDPFDVSV